MDKMYQNYRCNIEKIKVIGWTDIYNANYPECTLSDRSSVYYKAVIEALKENEYKFTGDYHQNGEYGAPVFNDGTLLFLSIDEWGWIIAKTYGIYNEYGQLDRYKWAWLVPQEEKEKIPDKDLIPAERLEIK